MTQTDTWNGETTGLPVMITVTEDGKQVPAEVAGRALIWVGQKNRKLLGEALAFALLGAKE